MSMAHSLEVRVPLLDHILVEQIITLPATAKRSEPGPKPLLVRAMGDLLAQEVKRGIKRTFTFPWQLWLRGPMRAEAERYLLEELGPLKGVLRAQNVRDLWNDFLEGRASWPRPWALYVLKHWIATNLE